MLNIFNFWKKKSSLDDAHEKLYKVLYDNKCFIKLKSCSIDGFSWEKKMKLNNLSIIMSGAFYSDYITIAINDFIVNKKYSNKFKKLLMSVDTYNTKDKIKNDLNKINSILNRFHDYPILLNCPFCGSKPTKDMGCFVKYYYICCPTCGARVYGSTMKEALYKWNRRHGG